MQALGYQIENEYMKMPNGVLLRCRYNISVLFLLVFAAVPFRICAMCMPVHGGSANVGDGDGWWWRWNMELMLILFVAIKYKSHLFKLSEMLSRQSLLIVVVVLRARVCFYFLQINIVDFIVFGIANVACECVCVR